MGKWWGEIRKISEIRGKTVLKIESACATSCTPYNLVFNRYFDCAQYDQKKKFFADPFDYAQGG